MLTRKEVTCAELPSDPSGEDLLFGRNGWGRNIYWTNDRRTSSSKKGGLVTVTALYSLKKSDLEKAGNLLAEAFQKDPFMEFALAGEISNRQLEWQNGTAGRALLPD